MRNFPLLVLLTGALACSTPTSSTKATLADEAFEAGRPMLASVRVDEGEVAARRRAVELALLEESGPDWQGRYTMYPGRHLDLTADAGFVGHVVHDSGCYVFAFGSVREVTPNLIELVLESPLDEASAPGIELGDSTLVELDRRTDGAPVHRIEIVGGPCLQR